jgi:hypothetical protein
MEASRVSDPIFGKGQLAPLMLAASSFVIFAAWTSQTPSRPIDPDPERPVVDANWSRHLIETVSR